MNIMKNGLAAAALAVLLGAGLFPKAQAMNNALSLDARQRSTVTIAAFTASGNMEKLNAALNRGLDAGLTVNEIKEALVQMYAYAGFPAQSEWSKRVQVRSGRAQGQRPRR